MTKTIRELVKEYPELWDYDYKWTDSENFRRLDEVLDDLGYELIDEDKEELGEYNDLKGYFNCEVKML